jgi:glycerol-3-phosphate dehydrogenase
LPYTIGEMRYAVRCEFAQTLADLLMRRTHLAFETRDHGLESAERVARSVGSLLRWTNDDIRAQIEAYRRDAARIFAIDP